MDLETLKSLVPSIPATWTLPKPNVPSFLSLSDPPQKTSSTAQQGNDGRGWMTSFSDSVIFHVSLGYNLVRHDKETQPWWDKITDTVILGALPFNDRDHICKLKNLGVGGVLILCKDYELAPNLLGTPVHPKDWAAAGVDVLHLPTQDFTAPNQDELQTAVDFMIRMTSSGKTVYVHCKAGRGRSVACVVCYLVATACLTTREAIDFIRSKRSHINMGAGQLRACVDYENSYRSKNHMKVEPLNREEESKILSEMQDDAQYGEEELAQEQNETTTTTTSTTTSQTTTATTAATDAAPTDTTTTTSTIIATTIPPTESVQETEDEEGWEEITPSPTEQLSRSKANQTEEEDFEVVCSEGASDSNERGIVKRATKFLVGNFSRGVQKEPEQQQDKQ